MGNTTEGLGLWSPDDLEGVTLDVFLAAMQQSVENAILPRLLKQEKRVGLRATLGAVYPFDGGGNLPITVATGFRYSELNYIRDVDLTGGAVTIQTAGLYKISCVLALGAEVGIGVDFNVRVNGDVLQHVPMMTRPDSWVSGTITDAIYLEEGDVVTAVAGINELFTGTAVAQNVFFSMAMLYAT